MDKDISAEAALIGERLRQAMSLRNVSARSLAAGLKAYGKNAVTRTTIGYYLQGTYSPTVVQILDIARLLRVRTEWLLTGEGEIEKESLLPYADSLWEWAPPSLHARLSRAALVTKVERERTGASAVDEKSQGAEPSGTWPIINSALKVNAYLLTCLRGALASMGFQTEGLTLEQIRDAFPGLADRHFEDAIVMLLRVHEMATHVPEGTLGTITHGQNEGTHEA